MPLSRSHSCSSDSDDEDDWSASQKKSKKKKSARRHIMARMNVTNLEEGEISSDDLDDDDDDGLDENLIGGEDDKRKLEKMSEKEREEELFKRAERRDAIQARRAVKQKLKERRDREKAEMAFRSAPTEPEKMKRQSAYANVFSSDSEEALNSDSSDLAGPKGIRQRKRALEKRKEAHSHKFHELIERRRQQAAKKQRMLSGSEEDQEHGMSQNSAVRSSAPSSFSDSDLDARSRKSRAAPEGKLSTSMSQRIFSDASDSSDSSHRSARPQARRHSLSSLSCSQRSESSSDDDARGRSRSPEEALVSSLEQLSRIRLSRFKLEKWVHMPFFDDLVKGCFVRINIGLYQGVPVYRVAEIVDVLETPKIYDLGDTRTNKGMVVRVGKDQSTFRLAFVSNSEFTQSEFESWMRRITDVNMKPPTLVFVDRKAAEIEDAITRPIRDDRIVEQIVQSKKRFQRAPTNFALRKAELIKQRELAEADGDTDAMHRLDLEIEDIESQAERIDRRRTLGFKSITSINQRNRVLSVQQAEEAIRKESEEAMNSKEDDPFTRVHSQPVMVTKKYLELLRQKRSEKAYLNSTQDGVTDASLDKSASESTLINNSCSIRDTSLSSPAPSSGLPARTGDRVNWSLGEEPLKFTTPHDSLHAIHNFEININLDLDGAGDRVVNSGGTPSEPRNMTTVNVNDSSLFSGGLSTPGMPNGTGPKPNRRLLNLQEYKKRMGLI